jgi:SAM-dependent methyltransferase
MNSAPKLALFDPLAENYDAQFSDRLPAKWLRAAVYRHVEPLIEPGSRVFEVGCGTGLDAVRLAQLGCRVWATDVSARMLELASARAQQAGLAEQIHFHGFDVSAPGAGCMTGEADLDLVFANFGVINCVEDLRPFFAFAQARLKPGGTVALTVMGRFCLWETLYFLARGRFAKAVRRWSGASRFDSGAASQTIWFHSPRQVLAAAPAFRQLALYGIGALIPNSEAFGLCERFPRTFRRLAGLDVRIARFSHWMADHYVILLKKSR